jgi:hypothetical protein
LAPQQGLICGIFLIYRKEEKLSMNASRELVNYFCSNWKKKYSLPYVPNLHRDPQIFDDLLQEFSSDSIKRMISFYLFHLESMFAEEGGHTLGIFRAMLPTVIAQMKKAEKLEEEAKAANKTDYLRLIQKRKETK